MIWETPDVLTALGILFVFFGTVVTAVFTYFGKRIERTTGDQIKEQTVVITKRIDEVEGRLIKLENQVLENSEEVEKRAEFRQEESHMNLIKQQKLDKMINALYDQLHQKGVVNGGLDNIRREYQESDDKFNEMLSIKAYEHI